MTAQLFPPGAASPDDAAGLLLNGRFRLEDQVGMEADAAVWRASDERLCRAVTIHMLHPGSVTPELASTVKAAAGISDPRLARIFDVAYNDERPYVVSEWAPGKNIEELLLAIGCPAPCLAGRIIADAAEALAIAHNVGVAHLCLGPRSLHWGSSGVKITGLGIEAALRRAQAADAAAVDTRALGRMLYALLTGCWPGTERTALPPAPRRRGRLCPPRKIRALPRGLSTVTASVLPDGGRKIKISEPAELALAVRRAVRTSQLLTSSDLCRVEGRQESAVPLPSPLQPNIRPVAALGLFRGLLERGQRAD